VPTKAVESKDSELERRILRLLLPAIVTTGKAFVLMTLTVVALVWHCSKKLHIVTEKT
jgi:hypothetical protein